MEWHSQVQRPGAVTIWRWQNVIPGRLKVVPVRVGHGTRHAIDWWGRCGLVHWGFQAKGLAQTQLLGVAEGLAGKSPWEIPRVVLAGVLPQPVIRHLLQVGQQVLVPGALLHVVLVPGGHSVHGSHGRGRERGGCSSSGGRRRLVNGVDDTGWHGGGHVVGGHPGAGMDQQVPADGAGVRYLSLTDRGRAEASPGLAELVDLVHDAAQVGRSVLVQAGSHGERNG